MIGWAVSLSLAANHWLLYIGAGMIIITGIFADTARSDLTAKIHSYSAVGGMIIGMVAMGLFYNLWWLVIPVGLFIGWLYYANVKNKTYWAEVAVMAVVNYGVLLKDVCEIC